MIKNRSGVIITVSSGFPDISIYCASKFGILGITESSMGGRKLKQKINAIYPGKDNRV
jgi:NAD(P)-dependent dehydrogenase (short-subunit alcohol dehydrogenase family)